MRHGWKQTVHRQPVHPRRTAVDGREINKPCHTRSNYAAGKQGGFLKQEELSATLDTHATQTLYMEGTETMEGLTVRRLTPLECERLQGFPGGYTDVPYKGCDHAPDGARYKALGNSMAVPVMRWIGEGIQLVEDNKELFEEKQGA